MVSKEWKNLQEYDKYMATTNYPSNLPKTRRQYRWQNREGEVFGDWTVIKRHDDGNRQNLKWVCSCVCGMIKIVYNPGLVTGNSTNCGCKRKNKLLGQRFGMWKVIDGWFVTPGRRTHWLCLCDCGKQKLVEGHTLTTGHSKSCGCNTANLIAEAKTTHGLCGSTRYAMFQSAKSRARLKGLEFNISLDDITIPDICPLLEIPITKGQGTMCFASPSLDRILTDKGYVKGNVQVISYKANAMKQGATLQELQTLTRNLEVVINGTSVY